MYDRIDIRKQVFLTRKKLINVVTTNNKSIIGPDEISEIVGEEIAGEKIPLPEKLYRELIEEGWMFIYRCCFGDKCFNLNNAGLIYSQIFTKNCEKMTIAGWQLRKKLLTGEIEISSQTTVKETIKPGWAMVSANYVWDFELNYLEQTEKIFEILSKIRRRANIFQNLDFENYSDFYLVRNNIDTYISRDYNKAVNDLANLKLNNFRHSMIEFIFDAMMVYLFTGEIYLRDMYCWTKSLAKEDTFVVIGDHNCPNLIGYADSEPFFTMDDLGFSISIDLNKLK